MSQFPKEIKNVIDYDSSLKKKLFNPRIMTREEQMQSDISKCALKHWRHKPYAVNEEINNE